MSEYLIKGETLTAIADEVRELSGTTEAMCLGDVVSNLGEANNAISGQSELLTQILVALEGKAGGGGSVDFSPFSQILTGIFSPTSNTPDFTIPDEATGTVGFLIVFAMEQTMYLVQTVYVNLGNYYGTTVLYKHAIYDNGTMSTDLTMPTVSEDGRTFSNTKKSMYCSGIDYGYALGMVNN